MSDFLKNLRSLFIEDSKPDLKKEESGDTKETFETSDTPQKVEIPGPEPVMPKSGEPGKVSEKFTKVLLKSIEKYNQDGFDYLEYKNSVRSLSKMSMNESTRFQSALAMAQTMGTTADQLISSAKHYQNVLTDEKKKFDQAAQMRLDRQVKAKRNELSEWEKEIEQKEKMIEELKNEVKQLRVKMGKVSERLEIEEAKVERTQADFIASYNNLYNQISSDIDKMSKYLK
ncbi:MAG: hypothetical protein R3275_03010 [Saprospiraceae bacterium]|nr:hypothetical protein [Saprospiraceae bacterium]